MNSAGTYRSFAPPLIFRVTAAAKKLSNTAWELADDLLLLANYVGCSSNNYYFVGCVLMSTMMSRRVVCGASKRSEAISRS